MKDCGPPVKITMHAAVLDVTPQDENAKDKSPRKGGVD
jgi:hypothetical protein